jgi:hypothetical protein
MQPVKPGVIVQTDENGARAPVRRNNHAESTRREADLPE